MTDIYAQLTAAVELAIRNDLHAPSPVPAGVIAGHVVDVLSGVAVVDSRDLVKKLDELAAKYDASKLPDHARGVRHAGKLVVAALLTAANAAERETK